MAVKVLFVCVRNSARSQMAEAFLNALGGGKFSAESAGLQPGALNPLAVEAMKAAGIDISGKKPRSVADALERGGPYDYLITVCDEASATRCPILPGPGRHIHWGFDDPAGLLGDPADRLSGTKRIRDQIKRKVEEFIQKN